MNISRLYKGPQITDKARLVVGDVYCVTYKSHPDAPCIFAKYSRKLGVHYLFNRVDLPAENSPNFDPYEPLEIGGCWADIRVFEVTEDPAVGGRRRKTRRSHRGRKHTRKSA